MECLHTCLGVVSAGGGIWWQLVESEHAFLVVVNVTGGVEEEGDGVVVGMMALDVEEVGLLDGLVLEGVLLCRTLELLGVEDGALNGTLLDKLLDSVGVVEE